MQFIDKICIKRRLRPVTSVNQCKGLAKFSTTYRHIRNAEARGSSPLCSTINPDILSDLQPPKSGGRSLCGGNLRECFFRVGTEHFHRYCSATGSKVIGAKGRDELESPLSTWGKINKISHSKKSKSLPFLRLRLLSLA